MKLTVAANYDPAIIEELRKYPVDEVFGKFATDFAGGGRPSYMGTPLSKRHLTRYVAQLADAGIAFNYLLNAACTGNNEWTARWQRQLHEMLRLLGGMGITRLTVSNPFLLETIKERFPEFKIKAGLYAMIDSVSRAQFWEKLGADTITLECRSINRDFARLRAIRRAVKCELQLIANHICIPNCPMLGYHQNSIAHASDGSRTIFIDYCFFRCSRMRMEDPSLLIKAGWIRPEDIAAYEAMGFGMFKILERGMPSEEVLKRVTAYSRRRFEGNLAELLLPYGFKREVKKPRFWVLRNFLHPLQVRTRYMAQFLRLAKGQGMMFARKTSPFFIDSNAIEYNFLDHFRHVDCSTTECSQCGYCQEIAARAVQVDAEFRQKSIAEFVEIETLMRTGRLWGV